MSDIGAALELVDQIRHDIANKPDVQDLLVEARTRFGDSAWAFVCGVLEMRIQHCDHLLARLTALLRELEVEHLEQLYQENP